MYEKHFRLAEAPFRLTPDPRFLFLSARHREAIAHLRYGLDDGAGFVAITGEIGAGKTTLVRSVLRESEDDLEYAYVLDPNLRGVELLAEVNQDLGLVSQGDRRVLIGALHEHLLERRRAGARVVVVIDEAQALDVETLEQLRILSNFETETAKLLQIVLVGQPELRDLLARPELEQLGQRVAVRFHLGALDRSETAAYVEHRLAVASGGTVQGLFSRPALARVHREARGLPRLINVLCHRALLQAYAAGRPRVDWRMVGRAAGELAGPLGAGRGEREAMQRSRLALAAGVALVLATTGIIAFERNGFGPTAWWPRGASPEAARSGSVSGEVGSIPATSSKTASAPLVLTATMHGEDAPVTAGADAGFATRPASPDAAAAPVEGAPDPGQSWADPVAQERLALAEAGRQWSAAGSAYEAVEALLRVWALDPLGAAEAASPALDLEAIATARRVQYSAFDGSLDQLAELGVPAILELDLGGSVGWRYALLRRIEGEDVLVVIGRTPLTVSRAVLEEAWLERAHIVWQDRLGIGPLLAAGAEGPRVERLHELLVTAGFWDGRKTAAFDQPTVEAVVAFQHSRGLVADGLVGPVTLVALYRAALGAEGPALVEPASRVEARGAGRVRGAG